MAGPQNTGIDLAGRVAHLELAALKSMRASVRDYYCRTPSRGAEGVPGYPSGSEKELYAELAYILLASPPVMLPALLGVLDTEAARQLSGSSLAGSWRAYRLSTIRPKLGLHWTGPRCFPGAAGQHAICDLGLLLDPSYEGPAQLRARMLLYFEIKSSDRHRHKPGQLKAHLKALDQEVPHGGGFLGAIGGSSVELQHPRWLGHVTLETFLRRMLVTAQTELRNTKLASEIGALLQRKALRAASPNKPLQRIGARVARPAR